MPPLEEGDDADPDRAASDALVAEVPRRKGSGPHKPTGLQGSDADDIPNVRCGFTTAYVGTLSPLMYEQVKPTGLASLLTTRASGGGDNKMYWSLLMNIDTDKKTMTFPDGQNRPLNEAAIEFVTGIKSGSKPIPLVSETLQSEINTNRAAVLELLGIDRVAEGRAKRGKIQVKEVVTVLRNIDPRSTNKKHLDATNVGYTLLVCATMIAPQASCGLVPDEVLHCVIKPDKIGSFNWGKFIIDHIMQNAKDVQLHYKNKSKIGACPMGGFQLCLQVWNNGKSSL